MEERINDKINEINKFLEQLQEVTPKEFEEYKDNFKTKCICERLFEKIVEGIVDIAFLIIKEKNLKIPEGDKEAFIILSNADIISQQLANNLGSAKGMRNIIAHEYGKIDDIQVFHAVSEEIQKDTEEFLLNMEDYLKTWRKQ